MVTIKNDIESTGVFIPTTQQQPVKDVNLKQQGPNQQPRRRSYRCVTIVSVLILAGMALGIGGVLFFGPAQNRRITKHSNDDATTTTTTTLRTVPVKPEEAPQPPPTFTDPFDETSDESETAVGDPTDGDDDDGFDIDGPAASSTASAPPSTTTSEWSDEGSGDSADADSDDDSDSKDDDDDSSGSGSGHGSEL